MVENVDFGAVGEVPASDVGLPAVGGRLGSEALPHDEPGTLVGLGYDESTAGKDPPKRRHRRRVGHSRSSVSTVTARGCDGYPGDKIDDEECFVGAASRSHPSTDRLGGATVCTACTEKIAVVANLMPAPSQQLGVYATPAQTSASRPIACASWSVRYEIRCATMKIWARPSCRPALFPVS